MYFSIFGLLVAFVGANPLLGNDYYGDGGK